MKFSTTSVLLALATLITAQSTTSVSPPSTTTYALTPQQSCLAGCNPGDVNCQAACVGSAHPNSAQVSETNECAAKCVQGDGSTSATNQYAQCLAACISSYYPTSQTVGPAAGGSSVATNSASATGSGASSGATATHASSGSSSGTASGSAASASSSKAAGATAGPFVGGLAGLVIAVMAL